MCSCVNVWSASAGYAEKIKKHGREKQWDPFDSDLQNVCADIFWDGDPERYSQ